MSPTNPPPGPAFLARSAVWQDRTARTLLLLGFLVGGLHLIVLALLLPRLPATVPLHMDGDGLVLLSGPPTRLFLPALYGLLTWLANGVLGWYFYERRDDPVIATLLWGAALAVQLSAWLSLRLLLP